MLGAALGFSSLLAAGLLAGEEVAVCYGVRRPLRDLDPAAHVRLRQALIRTLRVLVPSIFAVALFATLGTLLLASPGTDFGERVAGLATLVAFIVLTLSRTVPINQAVLKWDPDSPPADWRLTVRRWERLDITRTWLAVLAFALLAAGTLAR